MKKLGSKLKSFWRISRQRKILFFKVIGLSIYREILFYTGSSKAFSEKIIQEFSENEITKQQFEEANDIAFTIGLAAKYIPWPNLCRHQSWQAIYLLNEKKIPFKYQVGIKKSNGSEGHSWVMVGDRFISGVCDITEYQLIIFSFSR